ncbi:pyrroline-5-carboxylate reductase [Alphaproteobacteria bacterium]|nr:pyrroline-5-carboxylate reductase [Alphaproteobacteria bacterium]
MKNIILFGYGKMGSSIAKGWMLKKLNFNFFVIEKVSSLRKVAGDDGFKAFENINKLNELVEIKSGDIFFLAVKPQQMKETIDSFFKFNINNILFISIAAGLSLSWFQSQIGRNVKMVRAMPNLPASIGFGITAYSKTNNLSENDVENTNDLLRAFGKVIYLSSEDLMDVVTAISGSGPAYIFYLVEVLSKIGKENGLQEQDARTLALETLIGSSRLLEVSNIDPEKLKKNVTSPGGTTEAGLEILESMEIGLYPLLNSTIKNAKKRALALNKSG